MRERLRVCDHEVREKAADRFFFLPFHHLLDPRMRQNANQVTFSKHSLPNVETIELIVSTDEFIQINSKYDFDFVS